MHAVVLIAEKVQLKAHVLDLIGPRDPWPGLYSLNTVQRAVIMS